MPDTTTEDGVLLFEGDRAFNYYDHKWGRIGRIDSHAQPNGKKGQNSSTPMEDWDNYWFQFHHDDGSQTTLDGSRICSTAYAHSRGW